LVDASLLEGAPTSRPEPETPEVPEPEIEQPTQRLDISKHGPRPGDDEPSLVVRRVVIDESIETSSVEEGGTGTFAAIEDDMMVARLKSQADAAHHAAAKQAEADKLLLTPDFLRLQQVCGLDLLHVGGLS
jgi:hypothetical protein